MMAKFQVRMYYEYVDAFDVEAETAEHAVELAEALAYVIDLPTPGELEPFAGKCTRVVHREYVGYNDTLVEDEQGNIREM
jgi:hypothetical protein